MRRATGIGLKRLADLAQLAEVIADHAALWQGQESLSLSAWIEQLEALCDAFFGVDEGASPAAKIPVWSQAMQQRQELCKAITQLAEQAQIAEESLNEGAFAAAAPAAGGDATATIRRWRRRRRGAAGGMGGHPGAGGGHRRPGRGWLPRSEERPGWQPGRGRRWGDPDRREDDRHAFMAILAAEDRLF